MNSYLTTSPGVTNKREWDSFVRSKERFRVHSYFQGHKVELFNIWLDSEKSWDKTVLEVERIQTHSNEAKKGWHSVQGKTLKLQYSAEKAQSIMCQRVKDGMYYDCGDFPGDEDETC